MLHCSDMNVTKTYSLRQETVELIADIATRYRMPRRLVIEIAVQEYEQRLRRDRAALSWGNYVTNPNFGKTGVTIDSAEEVK